MTIALIYSDDRIGIMQLVDDDGDDAVVAAIAKMVDQPIGWKRITAEEADRLREARPKPEERAELPQFTGITEERARELAAEAANIAVRAFAAEIAKSAGGGDGV